MPATVSNEPSGGARLPIPLQPLVARLPAHLVAAAHLGDAVTAGELQKQPPADLNDWKLFQLVSVARHAGLIEQDTRSQCDLSRDFRNLIHPGVTLRIGQRCDKGTALAAAAAVAFVTRDLEKRFP